MFTFSVVTYKHLVSHRSLKLICKNVPFMITSLRCLNQLSIPEILKTNENTLKLGKSDFYAKPSNIILINKLINRNRGPDGIPWGKVVTELKALNISNTHSVILQVLLRLQNVDDGVNFYNYWIKKGEKFTILDLINFLKLISSRKDIIKENECLIKFIYDNIKDYLLISEMIQNYVMDVIAEVPCCFYDFVKYTSERNNGIGNYLLMIKALELDKPEIAWHIVNFTKNNVPEAFAETYMNFFIRMAEKGQFSPELLTQMTKSYEDIINILYCKDLQFYFNNLIQIANKHQNDYFWSARECIVNDFGVCSNCQSTLVEKSVSETEFNNMKKDFLSQIGLFHHSVFLSTSDNELNDFTTFLNNCKPYDIVVDALNVIHRGGYIVFQEFFQLVKLLVNEGFSVLIIGRQHIRKTITSSPFLKRNEYRDKVQYFFLSNLSDDDVFIIYATLHGGLGTYFISKDFLSRYDCRLSPNQRNVFRRWKISHQYIQRPNGFRPPRRHLGVPQLTTTPDQNGTKFIWHISSSSKSNSTKLSCQTPLHWTCVQAIKKKNYNNSVDIA